MKGKFPVFLSILSGVLLSFPWLIRGTGWMLMWSFIPLLFSEFLVSRQDRPTPSYFRLLPVLTFFSWNLLSVWWIGWVSLGGMLLIVAANSALQTMVWWGAAYAGRLFGFGVRLVSLIFLWLAYEFLVARGPAFWPWLLLGNGFAWSVKLIQWYEYTGVPGGTFWILLCNGLGFIALRHLVFERPRQWMKWVVALMLAIGMPIVFSLWIYKKYDGSDRQPVLKVGVIQPNIDPYTEKFGKISQQEQLEKILFLAGNCISSFPQLMIAPETSLPTVWEDSIPVSGSTVKPVLDFISGHPGTHFIGGSLTKLKIKSDSDVQVDLVRKTDDGTFSYLVFNSAIFFGHSAPPQIYHKNILVNGVERLPLQHLIPFADFFFLDLGGLSGGLASGDHPVVFAMGDSIRVGPVICFESAFGEYTSRVVTQKANLLVVLTNDGWWKKSAGTWQHFGYSRLRAIENRRSVARAANTGISGIIDLKGELTARTELNQAIAISSKLVLNDQMTFYTENGDYLGRMAFDVSAWGLAVLLFFAIGNRGKGKKNPH